MFNQAAHQVDIVRLLGGGRVKTVRAATGAWDAARPTEGAYSALLTFENGAFASLTYGGYGHFDSDEFSGWIGEMGQAKQPYARKPQRFANAAEEAAFKNARNYGGAAYQAPAQDNLAHQHFGTIIVSCALADLRPMPDGVMIYQNGTARLDPLPPPDIPRAEVIDELYAAVSMESRRCTMGRGRWRHWKCASRCCNPRARGGRLAPPSGGALTLPSSRKPRSGYPGPISPHRRGRRLARWIPGSLSLARDGSRGMTRA